MLVNKDDLEFYKIASNCIIEVDCMNSPSGIWWGVISDHKFYEFNSDKINVVARITGGKFQINGAGKPIYSNEEFDRIPTVNYTIYPDIEGIRYLFNKIQRQESILNKIKQEYHWLKELHIACKG